MFYILVFCIFYFIFKAFNLIAGSFGEKICKNALAII